MRVRESRGQKRQDGEVAGNHALLCKRENQRPSNTPRTPGEALPRSAPTRATRIAWWSTRGQDGTHPNAPILRHALPRRPDPTGLPVAAYLRMPQHSQKIASRSGEPVCRNAPPTLMPNEPACRNLIGFDLSLRHWILSRRTETRRGDYGSSPRGKFMKNDRANCMRS